MKKLKQYVSSNFCLSCRGCCIFFEQNSSWRPKVGQVERENVFSSDAFKDKAVSSGLCKKGYIDAVKKDKDYVCTFLQQDIHTCLIYRNRPFECQLYPFLLSYEDGQLHVCAHLSCPYIQDTWESEKFCEYTRYLQEFFKDKDVSTFLKQNPALWGNYSPFHQEIKYLFVLSLT